MTLHLIKLCVGVENVDDLRQWIALKQAERRRLKQPAEHIHTTRMVPKRADELLDGGSLYWVIKGIVQCRQSLIDIRPFTGDDGIRRCRIVMAPELVLTRSQPRRAFQGWRYLPAKDAPADIALDAAATDLPREMRRDLIELGLI